MMETKLETMNDVRAAVATLTSKINNMCNVRTTEEVTAEFVVAKDLLIALFKFNVDRTTE